MAHGAPNFRDCSWGPLNKLELLIAIVVLFARDQGELMFVQVLNKLCQEVLSRNLLAFGLAYCCYAAP